MNIQEYIASGVVELYVTGALCEEDARELESLASQYPELKSEIAQVEKALELYALANQVQPDASLKDKILSTISIQPNHPSDQSAPLMVLSSKSEPGEEPIRLNSRVNRLAIAASAVLLLISAGVAFRFYQQKHQLTSELAIVKANAQQQEVLVRELLTDANNQAMVLRGSDKLPMKMPQAEVKVFWNTKTQQVSLVVAKLPELSEGEQYQLWALKDDAPMDAGVFEVQAPGAVRTLKTIASADKWAVTVEPKGGSTQPHLDKLCLLSAG